MGYALLVEREYMSTCWRKTTLLVHNASARMKYIAAQVYHTARTTEAARSQEARWRIASGGVVVKGGVRW
jgi:hypothetical protein